MSHGMYATAPLPTLCTVAAGCGSRRSSKSGLLPSGRNGLAAFAVPDHYIYGMSDAALAQPAHDAFPIMAGLARETDSIELVILVSPITFRHPSVSVKNAATIQEMAGGRFKLGVGTGWIEQEHARFGIEFPETKERFSRERLTPTPPTEKPAAAAENPFPPILSARVPGRPI